MFSRKQLILLLVNYAINIDGNVITAEIIENVELG